MAERPEQKPVRHLGYLDSARGIAAIMVMVYHYINWIYESRLSAKVGSIVFNGSDAVSFFFVLSGFVLSYKYIVLNQSLDIKKFYINRLFRLWPAYFITIVLCEINAHYNELGFHSLANVFILNKTNFWEEAYLLRAVPNQYIPAWTLVIELALSFFIPFIVALAKIDVRILGWMLLAYLLVGNGINDLYSFHFILGVFISCIFIWLNEDSFKQTKWYRYRYFILAISFILYSIRHIDRISQLGPTYKYVAGYMGINFFHYTGIASFVFIIAIIISKKTQKILEHKVLRFLGKISYGIYLMHWMLVVDVFRYWDKIKPLYSSTKSAFIITFFIYCGITILLAIIVHYTIELPFIRMGKRLTDRLKPSVIIK